MYYYILKEESEIMTIRQENSFGEITISETVLRDITFKTVEKFLTEKEIYSNKIQREMQKNIKINHNDDGSVGMVLRIPAKYGENVVEFSRGVQANIKDELEKMSEIYVANIDITIESLEHPIIKEEEEENVVESIENEETGEEINNESESFEETNTEEVLEINEEETEPYETEEAKDEFNDEELEEIEKVDSYETAETKDENIEEEEEEERKYE